MYLHSEASDVLRDRLHKMQKLEFIDDIEFWMQARLLRNKIAYAYLPEQLKEIYSEIIEQSKIIFKTMNKLEEYFSGI
ncbi:hypothetical protein ACFL4A_00375 [bacterium]